MEKEEMHLGDIKRILFGQMPPSFILEVAIRTFFIYIILLIILRLMGKRMNGQITIIELAVMITLGAIVSPVMQLPDRGLLFGVLVLIVALVFQRGLNLWGFKNEKVEKLTQGEMSLLIKDGTLILEELAKTHITRQQVFSMLREKKIQNLGKVKRAYLEDCGVLSVFPMQQVKPGLPLFPSKDPGIRNIEKKMPDHTMACLNCGHVQQIATDDTPCDACDGQEWTEAYLAE
jgi:uncharacterized membrane protein YcaP (DUF421 family)